MSEGDSVLPGKSYFIRNLLFSKSAREKCVVLSVTFFIVFFRMFRHNVNAVLDSIYVS